MNLNVFLLLVKSNIYSPSENSLNYVNNNLNISWQNNFTENNIHIFLLQDEAIVKYPNNSNILSNVINNNGYYNWIPPYDLNKYNLNHMSFQFLLSNSSNPFSATLGHNQKNILGNNFYLETNVNISSPRQNDIIIPNTNLNIHSNGFRDAVNCSIIDNNDNIIDSFIMQDNYYNYNIPQYFQDYRNNNLQLILVEENTYITRIISNLKTIGINILPYSLINSVFIFDWQNVNFLGPNIIEIYYNDGIIGNITTTLNTLSYDLYNNYGRYDFIIYDENMFTFSLLNYNYLSTTPTSTQTTTYTSTQTTSSSSSLTTSYASTQPTTLPTSETQLITETSIVLNENYNNITNITNQDLDDSDDSDDTNWLKILIGFIVLIILLALSTYYYAYGCNCPNKKRRKKHCCFTKKDCKITPYNNKQTQTRKSYLNHSKNRLPPISNSRHYNNDTYGNNEFNNKNIYNNSNYTPKYQTPNNYNSLDRHDGNNYNKLNKNFNRNINNEYRTLHRQNTQSSNLYDEPQEYNDTVVSNSFDYSNPERSYISRGIFKNDTYGYNGSYKNKTDSYNYMV